MKAKRNYIFGILFGLLVAAFLVLLDAHGFASNLHEIWPYHGYWPSVKE